MVLSLPLCLFLFVITDSLFCLLVPTPISSLIPAGGSSTVWVDSVDSVGGGVGAGNFSAEEEVRGWAVKW